MSTRSTRSGKSSIPSAKGAAKHKVIAVKAKKGKTLHVGVKAPASKKRTIKG
jgi:hypothetical protein